MEEEVICTVLVVPMEAGQALVAEGPLGSRPPGAYRNSAAPGGWSLGIWSGNSEALVLAHEVALQEGCDRAARVANNARRAAGRPSLIRLYEDYGNVEDAADIAELLHQYFPDLVQEVVFLDPDGVRTGR